MGDSNSEGRVLIVGDDCPLCHSAPRSDSLTEISISQMKVRYAGHTEDYVMYFRARFCPECGKELLNAREIKNFAPPGTEIRIPGDLNEAVFP